MLRKNTTILLILFLQSVLLVAQSSRFKDDETLHVWASSGLNMRSKPDAKAEKIATIPYGAKVVVLPNIGVKIPFELEEFKGFVVKGYWLLVKYENTEGFVFDGFLSRLPAPTVSKNDTLGLEGYLNKCVGKIGDKFDFWVYDGVSGNEIRKARFKEKIEEKSIAGFIQKYNLNIQFKKSTDEGGPSFEIIGSELTLYEGYFLGKTFFFDAETDILKFDKTQKTISSTQKISSYGCSFRVKMVGKKIIVSGGCYC
jgi:Bacterial SH3 domain